MKFIGYTVTTIAILAFSIIYSGYVLSILWSWFIVPTFDLVKLTVPSAIGLYLIIGFMTKTVSLDKQPESDYNKKLKNILLTAVAKPSITLLFGWIVITSM